MERNRSKSPISKQGSLKNVFLKNQEPYPESHLKSKGSILEVVGKPKLIPDGQDYDKWTSDFRDIIGEIFLSKQKKSILKTLANVVRKNPDALLDTKLIKKNIEGHLGKLGMKELDKWQFSEHEKLLLSSSLDQMGLFVEILFAEHREKYDSCHTFQRLCTLYCANCINLKKECDIGYLFYLCNFRMDPSDLKELAKFIVENFQLRDQIDYANGTDVHAVESVLANLKNNVQPNLEYIEVESVPFGKFNDRQRARMMWAQRSFGYVDRKENPSEQSVYRENMLKYFICPVDLSFATEPNAWLRKTRAVRVIDFPIVSSTIRLEELGLLPPASIQDMLAVFFPKQKQRSAYRVLGAEYYESCLNFETIRIRPVVRPPPEVLKEMRELYKTHMVISIESRLSRNFYDTALTKWLLSQPPNFGTNLWVCLNEGTKEEINLMFDVGFFHEFLSINEKIVVQAEKYHQAIYANLVHLKEGWEGRYTNKKGTHGSGTAKSGALDKIKAEYLLDNIAFISSMHAFICNYPVVVNPTLCAFTTYALP